MRRLLWFKFRLNPRSIEGVFFVGSLEVVLVFLVCVCAQEQSCLGRHLAGSTRCPHSRARHARRALGRPVTQRRWTGPAERSEGPAAYAAWHSTLASGSAPPGERPAGQGSVPQPRLVRRPSTAPAVAQVTQGPGRLTARPSAHAGRNQQAS